jgi:hypothetical protein
MITFSAVSPPPLRGFVIRPFHDGGWDDDLPTFRAQRFPVFGVVVRATTAESVTTSEIIPVIHDPAYASANDGGLVAYNPDDYDDLAFSVVWCEWPPEEDEARLPEIESFVCQEAQAALRRQKRRAEEKRGERQGHGVPEFAEDELQAACYEVARITGWKHKEPLSTSLDAVTPMALRYAGIARHHADQLAEGGQDPNIIIRAIRYLAEQHAIPPMGDDIRWFSDMVDVLMGIVLWEGQPAEPTTDFFKDLQAAIARRLKQE